MKRSIGSLVAQMQKILENQNGTLSGGFSSLSNNANSNPSTLNQRCIQAETKNNGPCHNGQCDHSHNGGICLNTGSCLLTTDDGGSGQSCANHVCLIKPNSSQYTY